MPVFQGKTLTVDRDTDGRVVLKLDVPGRSVNVLNRQLLAELDVALDHIEAEGRAPLLVIQSAKPTGFLAGADLAEFQAIADRAAAEALSEEGQRLFNKLAAVPMPTIAAISGPCLGGGLELALACDYRLVFDKPSTQLGLPEVHLGLLPAWGGTQRLPRVIGLDRSFQIILGGRRLNAREALRWGLADAIAATEAELRTQFARLTALAMTRGKRPRLRLPLRTWRQRFLESHPMGRRLLFRGAERLLRRKTPDDMPAPLAALDAIRTGFRKNVAAGLERERQAAGQLAVSPACRNLIGLFLRQEAARKLPAALEAQQPAEVRRVGVVGAGVMGAGIAQLALLKGCEVIVQEVDETALGAGLLRIEKLFRKAVERRILTQAEAARRLGSVKGTVRWEGFDRVDVVIEAAVEDLRIKQALFHELEAHTRPDTVLASNTSSLRLDSLQPGLNHPRRLAGLHFFNPVHKMPLVEVVRTLVTDDRTLAVLMRWAIALGKTPVLVRDSAGFVVNRILLPYLNEATLLVAEGLGIKQIDLVMKRFGMPMGPLELLDQIGLDVAANVGQAMQPLLAGRFEANPSFEQMRNNLWLGQKNGRGFYKHGWSLKPNRLAENLLRSLKLADASPLSCTLPMAARLSEARERLVLLMVNEAAMALGEGLADNADAIDLAMILGTGWAPHRGGPLRYAGSRGLAEVVQALTALAARYGKRFQPCAELKRRAELPGE